MFDEDDDFEEKEPTPVIDLPWYETLRTVLEPYKPANSESDADKVFSSAEIISAIEQHHGVPQGPIGKEIEKFVFPSDFVRAMRYLGYREVSTGDLQLSWVLRKK